MTQWPIGSIAPVTWSVSGAAWSLTDVEDVEDFEAVEELEAEEKDPDTPEERERFYQDVRTVFEE